MSVVDGQQTDTPQNSEGQHTAPGPEQQGAIPGPARNSEGQQTCDADGDGAEQQDGDLLPTHPSAGGWPDTQKETGPSAASSSGPRMVRRNF